MTKLVVFDSKYGNTKQVAEVIASALGDAARVTHADEVAPDEAVSVTRAGELAPDDLAGRSLLVVGCPTHRFRPTDALNELLRQLPEGALNGQRAACFDTRVDERRMPAILRFFVRLQGSRAYAAAHLARALAKRGATLVAEPEGFLVQGMEGPLEDGELERAARWAGDLVRQA